MSDISLKSLSAEIGRAVGMSFGAVYERQRALVRAGLIEMGPGKGPGGGVRADAKAVAMMLISILATDSLAESEGRTVTVSYFPPMGSKRCPFTRASTFGEAMAEIIANPELAAATKFIRVSRKINEAVIHYHGRGVSIFTDGTRSLEEELSLDVSASLQGNLLLALSDKLQANERKQ